MIKIFCNELCIPKNQREEYYFLLNGEKLNIYDKSFLFQKLIQNGWRIYICGTKYITQKNDVKGRYLGVVIKNKNKIICNIFTGTLNTIKQLCFF